MQIRHRISYSSRSLTNPEKKNYVQIKMELLVTVCACEKFNQFVYGQPIFVKVVTNT